MWDNSVHAVSCRASNKTNANENENENESGCPDGLYRAVQDRVRRRGQHGDLTEREKETLRAVYLARLVPNYARQGYLRQLLEYAAGKKGGEGDGVRAGGAVGGGDGFYAEDGTTTTTAAPATAAEEEDAEAEDEVHLLNVLEVSKIVKRPRKMKFGRPVRDDEERILNEVELVPERNTEN